MYCSGSMLICLWANHHILEKWLLKINFSPQVWNFLNRIKEMQEVISSLSIQVTQLTAVASTTDEPTWEASKNACDALKVVMP